uniref:Uncharacterized protein n=1 Tax=Kryptolebias marmoratus TaxID=37003 RepID=A0A3Q3GI20_KRYMA
MLSSKHLFQGKLSSLQQHTDKPHSANVSGRLLKTKKVQIISPDLHPVEHLWGQPGRAVRFRVTNTTTSTDL